MDSVTLTASNEFYVLTARTATQNLERTRAAAKVVAWSTNHGIIWKAPLLDIAQRYLDSLENRRALGGFLAAATKSFRSEDVDNLTRTFIEVFRVANGDLPDSSGGPKPVETLWQRAIDLQQAAPWPEVEQSVRGLKQDRADTDIPDRYYKTINSALEAAGLSVTSELAALIYLARSRNDLNNDPLSELGININGYQDATVKQLEELGIRINKVGLDTNFWKLLKMLIGEPAAIMLRDHLITVSQNPGSANTTNKLENTITLVNAVHSEWASGYFYLEPLDSDESTPMSVDLSHFGDTPTPSRYVVKYHPLPTPTTPLSQTSAGITRLCIDDVVMHSVDTDPSLADAGICDSNTRRILVDGDAIAFETDDPEEMPLPHPHLLWLHGSLSRIVRLAGRSTEEWELGFDDNEELEEIATL
ncbi:hypothetical protein Dda_3599 [Drechslerella dactyloides]|uniref:HNH endonuclease n=1 Tax=Drechslerella dactyloides TaxID=74499 RepID=A0AAD6IY98_DREDA|nr:hypothetical protein Dda_3599 [Drechslerella dactyloides]